MALKPKQLLKTLVRWIQRNIRVFKQLYNIWTILQVHQFCESAVHVQHCTHNNFDDILPTFGQILKMMLIKFVNTHPPMPLNEGDTKQYVRDSLHYNIKFLLQNLLKLYRFCDVGCPNTRRSIVGYCIFQGANCISWSSKKQPTISQSSSKALGFG